MIRKHLTKVVLALALLVSGFILHAESVTLGQWCYDLNAAKAFAVANKAPIFCFYGVDGCAYCDKAITAFNTSYFKNYMAQKRIVFLWLHPHAWADDALWKFASNNWEADLFPAMRIWWPKTGSASSGITSYTCIGRLSHSSVKKFSGNTLQEKLVTMINTYTAGWSPADPASVFSFNVTQAATREGTEKGFSVSRAGGKKAMSVTLTIDAESGVTFGDGSTTTVLSWAEGATGSRGFSLKTTLLPALQPNYVATVTMEVPASTKDAPTQCKTKTLQLTVTDAFTEDYDWVEDIAGDWEQWESDDVDALRTEAAIDGVEILIKSAKTGVIDVTGSPDAPTVELSVGDGEAFVLSHDYACETGVSVGVSEGDWLKVRAVGEGQARVKAMAFAEFGAPTIVSPKNGASMAKDAVKANKALVDLSWTKVDLATSYELTVGDTTVTLPADVTSTNGVDLGAVSTSGTTDTQYTWTVKAICDGLDAGNALTNSVSGSFTLTVYPLFNLPLTAATIYLKSGTAISVAASGAPGITYSASGLPAGLSLNASTGVISGTPKKAGTYKVTVTARSSNGHASTKTVTVTVAKFPKDKLKGKFYGYAANGSGFATAGYEVSISASGKVSCKKTSASGQAKIVGSLTTDYSTGTLRHLIFLDGRTWVLSGNTFTSGSSIICKQAVNAGLNGYSNVAVTDASGNARGYLSVKVTSGKKAKVAGYIDGKKINKSVYLAVTGGTGKAFFGANGVYGLVVVTGAGATSATQVMGGSYTAQGCKFASSCSASAFAGTRLSVGGKTLPVVVNKEKIAVDKGNAYAAKLSWKKKTGVFKGKFDGQKYEGAFVKIGGAWVGIGSTVGGFMPVKIAK